MNGLAKNTDDLFGPLSGLMSVSEYTLIGGSALSIQINKRKSEEAKILTSVYGLRTVKKRNRKLTGL